MSCPLFVDNTRECIEIFKELVNFSNFDFCKSESFNDCIFYKSYNEPGNRCPFSEKCVEMHMKIPKEKFQMDFNMLNEMGKKYCFSKNRKNCAIYKKYGSGEEVSPFLHPDGSFLGKE